MKGALKAQNCASSEEVQEKLQQWLDTKARSFFDPLTERFSEVRPMSLGVFAGVLDYAKLSGPMRMVMKWKMNGQGIAEGDYRDWNAIETWGNGVSDILTARARGREQEI